MRNQRILGLLALATGLVLSAGVACSGDGDDDEQPTATAEATQQPTATAQATQQASPTVAATATTLRERGRQSFWAARARSPVQAPPSPRTASRSLPAASTP